MDRRSWLWRRKSSEKSPGETESSGSISSHSERYSDDQEALRASPNSNAQSPEVTSKAGIGGSPEVTSKETIGSEEENDDLKNLKVKLCAALSNISAKEELVKQHAKVAEEAVSGWEKAETEVGVLKQQLDVAAQKNSALEDRVGHLDGALKECLRQLRQARDEQEQKIHEAVAKKNHEFESTKLELESQIAELQTQVKALTAEAEAAAGVAVSVDPNFLIKYEFVEKENAAIKFELRARVEELEIRTLERDLSTQTAETASKQHLEDIKKLAKLEAECRRLRSMVRKSSSFNDCKSTNASSFYVESLTDSQSDSGERSLTIDNDIRKVSGLELNGCEPSCSDSWASALIAELDQFKNEKAVSRDLATPYVKIDLMDDFLEMERLAALPEGESDGGKLSAERDHGDSQSKADFEAMTRRTAELEERLENIEAEKAGLEMVLSETQCQLEDSQTQLRDAEYKLEELQTQLDLLYDSKRATEIELEVANVKREELESQLVAVDAEVQTLRGKVITLETEVEKERALSTDAAIKCRKLEDELAKGKREAELRRAANSNGELKIKQEKELAVAAGKLAECQKTIASLGKQLKSLASLEDFLVDTGKPLELSGGSPSAKSSGESWTLHSNKAFLPARDLDPSKPPHHVEESDHSMNNDKDDNSPPSSSSSNSSSVNHTVASEKSRNGFGKLFLRSKGGGIRVENQ
ncbi:hypothetical protein Syun_003155 [Stephania yunnanensis]|uniref:Filament-like plant protein n=1 Tax=Stephania yunnanensis TaxID=152371 RepID=A0AAP0L0Q3_9MAGN